MKALGWKEEGIEKAVGHLPSSSSHGLPDIEATASRATTSWNWPRVQQGIPHLAWKSWLSSLWSDHVIYNFAFWKDWYVIARTSTTIGDSTTIEEYFFLDCRICNPKLFCFWKISRLVFEQSSSVQRQKKAKVDCIQAWFLIDYPIILGSAVLVVEPRNYDPWYVGILETVWKEPGISFANSIKYWIKQKVDWAGLESCT